MFTSLRLLFARWKAQRSEGDREGLDLDVDVKAPAV
jgi:hypothetical protein